LFKVPVPDGGAEEKRREFMKMGITRYNKVIVPPTEQMKSRDILGIS
jgi:hypothetical protein